MKTLKGSWINLFINKDSKNTAIAAATSHTLKLNMDTKETTSKDSGGKFQELEAGVLSWSITSDSLYCIDETNPGIKYDDLVDMMLAQEPLKVVFGLHATSQGDGMVPSTGWTPDADACYMGYALITELTNTSPHDDKATISVSLQGTGEFKKFTTGS